MTATAIKTIECPVTTYKNGTICVSYPDGAVWINQGYAYSYNPSGYGVLKEKESTVGVFPDLTVGELVSGINRARSVLEDDGEYVEGGEEEDAYDFDDDFDDFDDDDDDYEEEDDRCGDPNCNMCY